MKIFRKIKLETLKPRNRSRFMVPTFISDVFDEGKVFLAGGAVRSVFDATPVADYDVYCVSKQDYTFVCEYFKGLTGKTTLKEKVSSFQVGKYKIQVMFWGHRSVEEVFDNFDMDCVRLAIDNEYFYMGTKRSIWDAKKKFITSCKVKGKNPFLILRRLFKYQRKGYIIDSMVWFELFTEVRTMPQKELIRDYDRIADAGENWETDDLTGDYDDKT